MQVVFDLLQLGQSLLCSEVFDKLIDSLLKFKESLPPWKLEASVKDWMHLTYHEKHGAEADDELKEDLDREVCLHDLRQPVLELAVLPVVTDKQVQTPVNQEDDVEYHKYGDVLAGNLVGEAHHQRH